MSQRTKISAGNGALMPGAINAIAQTQAGMRMMVELVDLQEWVDDALHRYSMRVDLSPARLKEQREHRARLHNAVKSMKTLLEDPATSHLVDLLNFHPIVEELFLDSRADDRGVSPNQGLIAALSFEKPFFDAMADDRAALPYRELIAALSVFDRALTLRVYEDEPNSAPAHLTAPFHELVGALHEIFGRSFEPMTDRLPAGAFDRFAAAVLHEGEIAPTNGGQFSETAIKDALRSYRRSSGET